MKSGVHVGELGHAIGLLERARRLSALGHRRRHGDGIEILTDYLRDLASLTISG